jgi:aminoglycoside/choline kinase family phosphotransferase
MALQRNIKALGSFAYLATKKNKKSYLKYVFFTLEMIASPKSQIHEETNLKGLFPNIHELVDDLLLNKYSKKLKKLIGDGD